MPFSEKVKIHNHMASSTDNQLYGLFTEMTKKKNGFNIYVKYPLKNRISLSVNLKAWISYFIAH